MSDTQALQLAVRAIEGFRIKNADLERQLAEAQGKLKAVKRVGEEYFRMGVGDVAYELRNAILGGTKEDE